MSILLIAILFWLGTWAFNEWLVRREIKSGQLIRLRNIIVPILFGAALFAATAVANVAFRQAHRRTRAGG